MYTEILNELGLAKNEGFIYVALVKQGGMGIAAIAVKSGVHRRNVYDSMQRLLEKGLVFEEIGDRENTYYAVDPHKLLEMVEEKRSKVESLMPELLKQFKASTSEQSVAIYRGIEGVKNYLLLLERERQPIYLFGATGASLSAKVSHIFKRFITSFEKNKIPIHILYHSRVEYENPELIGHFGKTSHNRIIAKKFDSEGTYVVFGDYICLQSGNYTDVVFGDLSDNTALQHKNYSEKNKNEESDLVLFILKSKLIANMMRKQFNAMWSLSEEFKSGGKK